LHQLRLETEELLLLTPDSVKEGSGLRIAICSDRGSWINDFIPVWALQWQAAGHTCAWVHDAALLPQGHMCFYLSYGRIVPAELRARHAHNLVVHESDLPFGRGWSPLTWQVLQGEQSIVVTLFEAVDAVDAGVIYDQTVIELQGDELVDDLRRKQAVATAQLCFRFVASYRSVPLQSREQRGSPSYFRRRNSEDSRIDFDLSLREQFNLLRVCDNERYPAWFEHSGVRYKLCITRVGGENGEG
jgi:methionyl-tRNA formyltransferase